MKAMDSEGDRGIPRDLYFWSRSDWQEGRSSIRKAQNKQFPEGVRRPSTERESRLKVGWPVVKVPL